MNIPRSIRKKQEPGVIGAAGWQALAGMLAVILTIFAVCFYVAGVFYWDRLLSFWYKVDTGLVSLDFHELVWLGGLNSFFGAITDFKKLLMYLLVPAIFVLLNHFVLVSSWGRNRKQIQSKFLKRFRLAELFLIEIVVLFGPVVVLVATAWLMIGFVQLSQNQADLALEKGKFLEKDSSGKLHKSSLNAKVSEFVLAEGCILKAAILGSTRNGFAVVRVGDEFGMVINANSIKAVFDIPEADVSAPVEDSKQQGGATKNKKEKLPDCVF
jgi:hypothetical protein